MRSMHIHLVIQYHLQTRKLKFAVAAVNVSFAVLFTSAATASSSSTCLQVSITNEHHTVVYSVTQNLLTSVQLLCMAMYRRTHSVWIKITSSYDSLEQTYLFFEVCCVISLGFLLHSCYSFIAVTDSHLSVHIFPCARHSASCGLYNYRSALLNDGVTFW